MKTQLIIETDGAAIHAYLSDGEVVAVEVFDLALCDLVESESDERGQPHKGDQHENASDSLR